MIPAWLGPVLQVLPYLLPAWPSRTGACACECSYNAVGPDRELLRLLERQLERCGPEHLRALPEVPST